MNFDTAVLLTLVSLFLWLWLYPAIEHTVYEMLCTRGRALPKTLPKGAFYWVPLLMITIVLAVIWASFLRNY